MSYRFSPSMPRGGTALALLFSGLAAISSASATDPNLIAGLKWRNIGPFRGGRISAVSGVIGQPGVFYAGLPLGGVWKTTNAGTTWNPIFDDVKESSCVGAVEVAPSDPNVIYVGMGDLITGGGINEGNGVYKSIDAGKTWQHMGLDDTKQIPSILVDPHNPNIVMVAAQGNMHEQSDQRGVFRSTDGGKTWTKTLYVSNETGIQKIAWAYDKPSVMLATTIRHYSVAGAPRTPGGGRSDGPTGTMLFKSTDEGVTWTQIKADTLPILSGRTCVAIANNTNAQRMYLVSNSGLYRSDDGGDHWKQMDPTDRRVANGQGGYNCGVYVDPKNPDVVYVVNTCSYVSRDGGNTFTGFKGAPGGDDPQQMWIDPTDASRILLGMDQGATVSLDAGQTWSSWYNQATAQVYHISVDNSYPYWVYATEQDSGSIGTRSRGDLGAITPLDWSPNPGYEFGSIVADPRDPRIIYAGGAGGGIVKVTYPSGQWINVSPNADPKLMLRHVGNQPLLWSPTNPKELFAGFQFLMSTTDGGKTWKKLSPDLGFPKGYKPPESEKEKEKAKDAKEKAVKKGTVQFYEEDEDEEEEEEGVPHMQGPPSLGGSIESFSPSSVDGKIIWVGTSNGLIKVTRDHGTTWEDVTIKGLPNPTRADISAIDASHQDPGTAYVAIDYHSVADYKPYLYRTRDFGQHWTKIVNGMAVNQPNGSFARVIRADTKKAGLLFAGTESSMYVSFNDGDDWQSLMLNLPNTSYRDMVIKDNDLVVGTYGRGFWILDDISPLREISPSVAAEPARLFKPGDAIRVRRNVNGDTPFPPEVPHALNPPVGAIIYYYLGQAPTGDISLDVRDSSGKLIRHMSSAPIPASTEAPAPVPDFWLEKPMPMPTAIGTNRINWNLRYDNPSAFSHSYEINANPGETPASPEGPLVAPGVYSVTLTVDGKTYTQKVTVKNDPRSPARGRDLKAQTDLQAKLYEGAKQAWDGYQRVAQLRTAITATIGTSPVKEVADAAAALDAKLLLIGGSGGGGRRFGGGAGSGGAAPAPTFAGVDGSLIRQMNSLDYGDMAPTETTRTVCKAALADLATVQKNWLALLEKDIPAFNALLIKNNLKPLP